MKTSILFTFLIFFFTHSIASTLHDSSEYRNDPKFVQAFNLYKQSADEGNSMGQFALGLAYRFGLGTNINMPLSIEWIKKSAQNKNDDAQYYLGINYLTGTIFETDINQGLVYLNEAANNKNKYAAFKLATMYLQGDKVEENHKTAIKYFQLAAKDGSGSAIYDLARMCQEGMAPLKKDISTCILLYKQAAAYGIANAAYNLGLMYYYGDHVKKDLSKAANWMQSACNKGLQDACTFINKNNLSKYIKYDNNKNSSDNNSNAN